MTIAELAPGQSGVIAAYRGADAEERHLLDMGLTPGVRVRLIGTALLGDPLILLVRGSRRVHPPASGAANHPVRW